MKIYTRTGDDGTTGLLYGGRVAKHSDVTAAAGDVDEAQACLGVARALSPPGSELDQLLVRLERDLYVLMAELCTAAANRHRLVGGTTLVTPAMVAGVEDSIDELNQRFEPPGQFVIPGQNPTAAALDLARTVVRRAERAVARLAVDDSMALAYLNRLSDLMWTAARWQEGESLPARSDPLRRGE